MALLVTPRQFRQRAEFYKHLSQMTSAGMGLVKALELQHRDPPDRSYRAPIRLILDSLGRGSNLNDALRLTGSWIPAFDVALMDAGERSGRLDACFKLLADYYDDRARMARQMISDLGYPVLLIHMAIFIFPFAKAFSTGNWGWYLAKTLGILIPLYALTAFFIYAGQSARKETWRANLERVLGPVPVLGTARHYLALGRLAAALEALLSAGVTMIEAWMLAAAASGSPALRKEVIGWNAELRMGRTPAELVHASASFPETFSNLYTSGEVSGKLDDSLRNLHKYYQEEGSHKMHLVVQWAPRFVYVIIAVVIGFKVVGFYTDYFQQIRSAGGY